MHEDSAGIRKKSLSANIFGLLSLFCCLPLLTLAVAGGRVQFPDWMFAYILYGIILSPFAGVVLALIAVRASRWWLLAAVVWLAVLLYGWWDLSHHPFVI